VRRGLRGVQRDGAAQQLRPALRAAGLERDQAQHVQAVAMARIGGQNVLEEALGLIQLARAVLLQGGGKGLLQGG